MSLQIPVLNQNESSGPLDAADAVFGRPYNEPLIHQIVVRYQALARSGTKAQKTRSEVSGGGAKPWRQKGTGRARAGSTRSPIWRTGGVAFAARPRSFYQKINKKMYRVGLRSIFSELLRQGRLNVSADILPTTVKTKELARNLKQVAGKRIVIVVDAVDENLALASRNIPYLQVLEAKNINPVFLVGADKVIITPAALKKIEEHLT